ncbi:MAG: phosphotransferase [Chloroflexi bacterium]|nr:phosphotransferase [Chloroflexota bacterium]
MTSDSHQPDLYDIHCHILPGLDDGPAETEDSLAMAETAVAIGVKAVVATPHTSDVQLKGGPGALWQHLETFRGTLREKGVPLEVLPGAEHRLLPELPDSDAERALTLNGSRYLLFELDFYQYPLYTDETLFQLRLRGLTPVIAHPERQTTIQAKLSLLEGLVERGVLVQVDAGSLVGGFGSSAETAAWRILELGLAHCVASDAHSSHGPRPTAALGQAMALVARRFGQEMAGLLFCHNPGAMINNRPPSPTRPTQRRRVRWPARWLRGE